MPKITLKCSVPDCTKKKTITVDKNDDSDILYMCPEHKKANAKAIADFEKLMNQPEVQDAFAEGFKKGVQGILDKAKKD